LKNILKKTFPKTKIFFQIKDKFIVLKNLNQLFNDEKLRDKLLEFDKELDLFNETSDLVQFAEEKIKFGPTYCLKHLEIANHSNLEKDYANKRIPAWTDRVIFTSQSKKKIFNIESYDGIYANDTGDHIPVTLTFSFEEN